MTGRQIEMRWIFSELVWVWPFLLPFGNFHSTRPIITRHDC